MKVCVCVLAVKVDHRWMAKFGEGEGKRGDLPQRKLFEFVCFRVYRKGYASTTNLRIKMCVFAKQFLFLPVDCGHKFGVSCFNFFVV